MSSTLICVLTDWCVSFISLVNNITVTEVGGLQSDTLQEEEVFTCIPPADGRFPEALLRLRSA